MCSVAPRYPTDPVDPVQEAYQALTELRDALGAHGIVLPSLDLDPATLAGGGSLLSGRHPLIELGRVNLATARRLARVLGQAGSR